MNIYLKSVKGVTLIELIIYIGVVSVALTTFVSFFLMVNSINTKNNLISLVENDSKFIFNSLERDILNSNLVLSPANNIASSSLVLKNIESGESLKYFVDNGILYIKDNGGMNHQLSSSDLEVNNLEFIVSGEDNKNIKISFLIRTRNSNSREFDYQKNCQNSITIR